MPQGRVWRCEGAVCCWRVVVVHRPRSSLFHRAALLPATGETCLRSYIFMYTYPCEAKRHGKRQLLSRTHSHTRKKNARAQTLLPTSGLSRRLTNRSWTIGTLYSLFSFFFVGREGSSRNDIGERREGIFVNFVLIFGIDGFHSVLPLSLIERSMMSLHVVTAIVSSALNLRAPLGARCSSWIVDS